MKKLISLILAAFCVFMLTCAAVSADGSDKFYYNQLSVSEQKAYNRFVTEMQKGNFKVNINDLVLDGDSMTRLATALDSELAPEVYPSGLGDKNWYTLSYYVSTGKSVWMTVNYNPGSTEFKKSREEFETAAAEIVNKAKKKRTDYAKLRYIHDWLVDNTDYFSSDENYEAAYADGPVMKGVGNCEGYAHAFQYLARSLGFGCIIVGGSTNGSSEINHAWNMVELDGVWYNVDVTWDDMSLYGDNKIYYDYFLKSDAVFSMDHTPEAGYDYPAAPKSHTASNNGIIIVVAAVLILAVLWRLFAPRLKHRDTDYETDE